MSDPKRLFPVPDPTLKGIPDPDPTLQVFPDPGQNQTFYLVKGKKISKSITSVKQWDCNTVFTNFRSIKIITD